MFVGLHHTQGHIFCSEKGDRGPVVMRKTLEPGVASSITRRTKSFRRDFNRRSHVSVLYIQLVKELQCSIETQ